VGPACQWQCRAAPSPDWLPWVALSRHVHGGLNALPRPSRRRPNHARPDRRGPKPPSSGLSLCRSTAARPSSSCRRPRAGEPCPVSSVVSRAPVGSRRATSPPCVALPCVLAPCAARCAGRPRPNGPCMGATHAP
jgi:hypothetical protein